MSKILSRLLYYLKYILLVFAFGLILVGIILTYQRLEKSMTSAIPTFLPFIILFILYVVNLFMKRPVVKNNLLYNFTSVVVLIVIIMIGVRAKFDTSMLLYEKYKIDYNPLYLSDNLASIKLMLYSLSIANVLLMILSLFDKNKTKRIVNERVVEP